MTLVLSFTSPALVVHSSDRRVTATARHGRSWVHSPVENKTIIFRGKDAVGVIGYTGFAYVKRQPTDQWLANVLAPQPAGQPQLGEFAFGGRGIGPARLKTLIHRLREAIRSEASFSAKPGLTILVSGYRQRRKKVIPFALELNSLKPSCVQWSQMRLPRSPREFVGFASVGDALPPSEIMSDFEKGCAASAHEDLATKVREGLVAATRARARKSALVGSDLMLVTIPHPSIERKIYWRYEADEQRMEEMIVRNGKAIKFPAIYTPWILTVDSVTCPGNGTGGWTMQASDYEIFCDTPNVKTSAGDGVIEDEQGNFLAVFGHQRRRPPPA